MKAVARATALVLACACLIVVPRTADAGFTQFLRAQTAIYILINVSPSPFAVRPDPRMLAYDGAHFDVAQVSKQGAIPVQANVIANPTGNLLTTSTNTVTFSQMAGTTATYPCAYHVKVTTAVTSWTLYTGLSSDFDASMNGNTLSWMDYNGTPPTNPVFQNFVVYPDNNNAWQSDRRGSTTFDECVDLKFTIPIPVPGGSYSTNAIYSLYY